MLLAAAALASALAPGPPVASDLSALASVGVVEPVASALDAEPPAEPSAIASLRRAADAPAVANDLAQKGSAEEKPPTPVHTGFKALLYGLGQDFKHLPSMPNLYLAAGGGVAALAVHPIDDDVNTALKSHYDLVNDIYSPAHIIGQTGAMMGVAAITYAVGRIADKPKASHFGMDLLRAQIISEVLVETLKRATRRERPNGSDNLSFPSGHSSVTFATATVIERHLGWKMTALGYGFAAYVGSSRLHDNVHWMSDVVFGAAVGTISGRTVTEHGRNFWSFAPAPVPGGAAVMVTRTRN